MQRDFDDFILASPIIQFFFLAAKNSRILHKDDCERILFYIVNEKDTQ